VEKGTIQKVAPTSKVCSGAPKPASQSLTVPSLEGDASSLLSGEKVTALTQVLCPSSVCSGAPEPASQSLAVLSSEADASSLPFRQEGHGVGPGAMPLERLQ
jgi:hypothetical protein